MDAWLKPARSEDCTATCHITHYLKDRKKNTNVPVWVPFAFGVGRPT
jgi:hypothetical protein